MSTEPRTSVDALLSRMDRVRGLALYLVRNAAEADDVVQEAVAAALRRPVVVHGEGDGWIAATLRNIVRDRARRTGRRDRRERAAARPEATGVDTRVVLENAERQRDVVEAVLSLADPYRETLLLRFFEDLPPREIVERTGRTPAAVRKHIDRGLAQVRAKLERSYGDRGQWAVALLPVVGSKGMAQLGARAAATAVPVTALRVAAVALLLIGVGIPAMMALSRGDDDPRPSSEVTRAVAVDQATSLSQIPKPADRASLVDEHSAGVGTHGQTTVAAVRDERPTATWTVTLIDLEGVPFSGAAVEWTWERNRGSRPLDEKFVVSASTDEAGRASLTGPTSPDFSHGQWLVNGKRLDAAGSIKKAETTWVVLAPSVRLAGRVVTPEGAPVPGATVRTQADVTRVPGFPLRAEINHENYHQVTTDELGRFDLGAVPSHPSFRLSVYVEGHFRSRRPVPAAEALDLELSAGRELPRRRRITGTVLEPTGAPAVGAKVFFEYHETESDLAGRFSIEVPFQPFLHPVSAESADGRFVSAESPVDSEDIQDSDADGVVEDAIVLRLPAEMGELRVRLVDAAGAPVEGYEVLVFDGTARGGSTDCLEDRGSYTRRTGEDGRYVVEGVAQRSYSLRFLNRETMHVLDTEPLTPGETEHVVTIPEDGFVDVLRGRVVDAFGAPVRGARVKLKADISPRSRGIWMTESGRTTETDAEGRFAIENAPWSDLSINVNPRPGTHDHGVNHEIGPARPDAPLEIQLEFECGVHVTTSRPEIVAIEALDAEGETVDVTVFTSGVTSLRKTVRRNSQGVFPLFDVSQRAATFVLHGEQGEIDRVSVGLDPSSRNELDL